MKLNCCILAVTCLVLMLVPAGCREQARDSQEPVTTVTTPEEPAVAGQTEPAPPVPPGNPAQAVSQPQPKPQPARPKPQVSAPEPEIRFEKLVHDFGEVGPLSSNTCEFRFTNVGKATLKIAKIDAPCGCTVPELAKKEYLAGESGLLKVTYNSTSLPGVARKYAYVNSNDQSNPKVTLTITAKITPKVDYEPKRLNILLKADKPECPQITLTSADGKPFSITAFTVPGGAITAEIDPSVEATKFVLQPKVDSDKLRRSTTGVAEISLTHPQCKQISIPFDALPKFKINPPVLILWDAEPEKPVERDIWVLNNYQEDFEIESVTSSNNYAKVLAQEKTHNGYKLKVEVMPPAVSGQSRFTDVLFVKIKDSDEKLGISCRGFYATKAAPKP